jgi:hypothetical protein
LTSSTNEVLYTDCGTNLHESNSSLSVLNLYARFVSLGTTNSSPAEMKYRIGFPGPKQVNIRQVSFTARLNKRQLMLKHF